MYIKEFPDIEWIRKSALHDFTNRKDYKGNTLHSDGWPNAILNVKSSMTERNNIKGPFSLFYNFEGKSLVGLNKNWHTVSKDFYCVSNNSQFFNLHIPKGASTTTFNIHFGKSLFEDVIQHIFHASEWALDNFGNDKIPSFEVLPRTAFMDATFKSKLLLLHLYYEQNKENYSLDKEYEITASILELLLKENEKKLQKLVHIRAQKTSTKKELFKRINIGLDYIHSNELQGLNLENISKNCGLSKFHFIRVFKEIYGVSPNDYIAQLKAQKAQLLLINTKKDLTSISLKLGFSELSAFTRFYKRMTGESPSSARSKISNLGQTELGK